MIHTQSHTLITDTLNSTPSNTHSLGSNNWPDTVSRIQSHHLNTHTHSVAHATKNKFTQSHTLNTHTLNTYSTHTLNTYSTNTLNTHTYIHT